MSYDFDLLVIGGGSGGLATARRAAEHGARCAVVEASRLGGTCVHRGCVPKKILWYAAEIAGAMHLALDYGFTASLEGLDWAGLKVARDDYLRHLEEIYRTSLEDHRIQLIRGRARFQDAHTVRVDGRDFRAPHIVIATGGQPVVPELPGAGHGITSDGFFGLSAQPRRVAVAGSGYIATELSCVLRALGSEVTLLIRKEWFLNAFDSLIRETFMDALQLQGIDVLSSILVTAVHRDHDGRLSLHTSKGHVLEGYDCLLWAVGRAPNTRDLGLEHAGVRCDGPGWIVTDHYQNTSVPGIYAVGDVTGRAALTPVAIAAGRRLADRLFGSQPDSHLDYGLIPTVIFSHPPAGSVGASEEAARARHGHAVRVYQSRFTSLQYALARRKLPSAVKLVTLGPEERVIGCHVVGPGADEMLQGFAVAMGMGACKADFDRTVAIHPTAAEELVTLR